jgi:hypothetical protein
MRKLSCSAVPILTTYRQLSHSIAVGSAGRQYPAPQIAGLVRGGCDLHTASGLRPDATTQVAKKPAIRPIESGGGMGGHLARVGPGASKICQPKEPFPWPQPAGQFAYGAGRGCQWCHIGRIAAALVGCVVTTRGLWAPHVLPAAVMRRPCCRVRRRCRPYRAGC